MRGIRSEQPVYSANKSVPLECVATAKDTVAVQNSLADVVCVYQSNGRAACDILPDRS